jgi:hypothetical protein
MMDEEFQPWIHEKDGENTGCWFAVMVVALAVLFTVLCLTGLILL